MAQLSILIHHLCTYEKSTCLHCRQR